MKIRKKMDYKEFFLENNKSGTKTRKSYLQKNYFDLYEKIINHSKHINDITFKERIWLFINDIYFVPKCYCGNDVKFKKSLKNGYSKYCSIKCTNKDKVRIQDIKETNIKKYGGVAPIHSDDVKNKIKETNVEKYGVENIFQDTEYIKEKTIESLGVTHISKLESVKEKRKQTNIKNLGVSTPLLIPNNRVKNLKSKLKPFNEKYKDLNIISDVGNNIIIHCDKCGSDYNIIRSVLFHRFKITDNPCTVCNPIKSGKSIVENELIDFIKKLNIDYIENDRTILNGKEIDIYIPSHNIGIEFNGLHWHSDKYVPDDYHLNKTELANSKGINLFHIFEDEWLYKKDIVKSRLENILGLTKIKIYGRKCEVKEVKIKDKTKFLKKNHIQGSIGSKINLGLYHEDELVSIMTFGKRKILKNDKWELIRFCNKLNTTVIGGASKLFKYFLRNYEVNEIISFADRRWSSGKLYFNLDFKFDGLSTPNYYYINNGVRETRFKYQKHKLVKLGYDSNFTEREITNEMGLNRIYDCGNLKYRYKKKRV